MEKQLKWEEEFKEKIYKKMDWVIDEVRLLNPYRDNGDGIYDHNPTKMPYAWFCGFWGGIQWWMYRYSGDEKFLNKAKAISEWMDGGLVEFVNLTHDVGFQYLSTTVPDYLVTGSDRAYVSSIHAANLLAGRFNIKGQYIRAWNENKGIDATENKFGYAIIDCMMNIPLLFWTSEVTNDPRYRHIAEAHADTVMKHFIREDGSSEHIVVFNPDDGTVVHKPKGQGYSEGSAWTRGQGWAVYGFAQAYHYTKKKEYLDCALKTAKYIFDRIPENGVLPADFNQPEEPALVDSSAGVIALCGMIDLKRWVDEETQEWLEEGIRKLFRGAYANCDFSKERQPIMNNFLELYKEGARQSSCVYADFYLIEALMKRRGEISLYEIKAGER